MKGKKTGSEPQEPAFRAGPMILLMFSTALSTPLPKYLYTGNV